MIFLSAVSLSILCLFSGTALSQDWARCAPPSIPRWNPGSAVIEDCIYLIGGQDSIPPFSSIADVEVFDASLNAWSSAAPMNHPRWGMMVSVVEGKIYAIGGQTGSFLDGYSASNCVEVYDPLRDSWEDLSPMPTARGWGGSAVFNDTIFVFGGYDPSVETTGVEVEKYCPETDTWSSDPPMEIYRETFSAISFGNSIYLIGGWNNDHVQAYDPAGKTWRELSPMPSGRGGSGVCRYDDYIVAVGGRGGPDAFEAYHVPTDEWFELVPLLTPREGLAAEIVDGTLYAITGSEPVSQGGLPYYGINECICLLDLYELTADDH